MKMVGIEGVIIWQDFINGINGITGTKMIRLLLPGMARGLFQQIKIAGAN